MKKLSPDLVRHSQTVLPHQKTRPDRDMRRAERPPPKEADWGEEAAAGARFVYGNSVGMKDDRRALPDAKRQARIKGTTLHKPPGPDAD